MDFKYILFGLLIIFINSGCNHSRNITDEEDYVKYLERADNDAFDAAKKEYLFWTQKYNKAPNQYPYLSKIASANAQLFLVTGSIEYLKAAEENWLELNNKTNYNNAGYLRALAGNYITQHQFKESLSLLQKASENGENLKATHKMLFDVYLELGNDKMANLYLSKFQNLNDFDYLIRLAKWHDHNGNLEAAILLLEKAATIAASSKNISLTQWSYTNLADFYGHAGRIEEAYHHYLKALAINPSNTYALKGIAWITYSYERNPEKALEILASISKQHHSPDYFLLLAEIAEYNNCPMEKEKYLQNYLRAIEKEDYGIMYNRHKAFLFAEEFQNYNEALHIAVDEINQRPTPQSYDLLAWVHFKKGDIKKALIIANSYLSKQNVEPEILYHIAEIYKANGRKNDANKIKNILLESTFELGPILEKKIKLL